MSIHRLCSGRYAATAFTGLGAALAGGRWNRRGANVVYTSGSLSLAALECLVHFSAQTLPDDYVSFAVVVPPRLKIETVDLSALPADWAEADPPATTQRIGSDWLKRRSSLLLKVPSAVIPTEFNYLINPQHPDIHRLLIGPPLPFRFDLRLKQ